MKTQLAYGHSTLTIEVPGNADIVTPYFPQALEDESTAILQALQKPIQSPPLSELAREGMRVVIAHSDFTRPISNTLLLPRILTELENAGVKPDDITLINATGSHRHQRMDELKNLFGEMLFEHYRCIQHDAFDKEQLISLGSSSYGHDMQINRHLLQADLKIFTGFIEPHLFAGFSGGPQCVMPGLAGIESILSSHRYHMLSHPRATWGITEGNPIWEEMLETALKIRPSFLVNATLNHQHQITGVFSGNLQAAHSAGCNFARLQAMVKVPHLYDVVITSNSGYPLDKNLYQSVKGMSAACQIVRDGGAILLLSACEEGLPQTGEYARLLELAGSPAQALEMISRPGYSSTDQWQVQIQAEIQQRADVYLYSHHLSEQQIRAALLNPCRDIPETLRTLIHRYGDRLCVLPDGPLTIPYL